MSDAKPVFSAKGRKRLAIFLVLIITSLLATGFVWATKKVNITVDDKELTIITYYSNTKDVLAQAGLTIGPSDEVRMSTEKLVNGTHIQVYRAIPLWITYQGKTTQIISGQPTVGEVIDAMGISADNIKLTPEASTPVVPNMNIQAVVLTEKIINEQVEDPIPIVHQSDANLEKGVEQMASEGKTGTKQITVKHYFADGQEVKSEVIGETVLVPAQPQVIHVGSRETVQTSRGNMRFRRIAYMEASAYHPNDGSGSGITATGVRARYGIVAVDPDVIPLGTRLYIPGYGLALAADTGGAIVGDKIDLCMEDYDEAYAFGRRTMKVYILSDS
jgi:3D (Asp-Asp-Asp) domain-containing protein